MGQRLDNARSLYLEAIRDGAYERAINAYAGERYTQHSTPVKDGKTGFIEFFTDFAERNPIRDIEILRSFEDGPYVFLHVLQTLNNGEFRYVTADIFDTDENAKLIEHWDIIAEVTEPNGSGHSQLDGPTEPTDLDKTTENKSLVENYLRQVLSEERNGEISDFVSSDRFVEHQSGAEDGIGHLTVRLSDPDQPVVYSQIHRVVGSGDLVAGLAQVEHSGTSHAVIDLFRVASGRIVEHWDVSEEITPEETWVNSGKF